MTSRRRSAPPATRTRIVKSSSTKSAKPARPTEGWQGWDTYAPFYDWENARTVGRRDVAFWTRIARQARGRVLELGCGTGRIARPIAAAGVDLVGLDRSAEMLAQSRKGSAGAPFDRVRGDIRSLPFEDGAFRAVIAPYGVLQSLTRPADLPAALASVARVLAPNGRLGIDLVPDVPRWREYENRVQLRGRLGRAQLTLVESVRQDRRRQLTIFEQCYIERRGRRTREHRFDLTFRTLTVPQMTRALHQAGFEVTAVLGDYQERPWDARADVWIILAKKG
ncbi:MAG TPA: class I SAM-dependent methyltransferase [Vicinamibacterales bacterium]